MEKSFSLPSESLAMLGPGAPPGAFSGTRDSLLAHGPRCVLGFCAAAEGLLACLA